MATFKFSRAIDLHWQGYEIVGPAETVFSIPDQLYEEFDADIAPVEPTLVWIDTNEFQTLENEVSTSTLSASLPIALTTTTSGKTISLSSTTALNGYLLAADGTGGTIWTPASTSSLTSVIGVSPISTVISGGAVSVSLNANYQTSGTYVTGVVGTSPISASGTTAITVSIDSSILTADNAARIRTYVRNATASTITKGSVVYLDGSNGTVPSIQNALANSDATSARTFGIVEADILTNSNGYVTNQGLLSPLDTSAVADGAVLWLSPTVAGAFTTTKPSGPNHGVLVGIVVKGTSVGAGSIYVLIKNGAELDEIHDVNISSLVNGQALIWSSSASVWQNQALPVSAVIGTSPASVLTASGTSTVSIVAGSINSTHLSATSVGSSQLIAQAVTTDKIGSGAAANGTVLTANGSGAATFATISGATVSTFTASGTYTKPASATMFYVQAVAGGGSGSGGGRNTANGSGGGAGTSGQSVWKLFRSVDISGSTVAVTIGAGGLSVAGSSTTLPTSGNAGGATSFGTNLLLTNGGAGGNGASQGSNTNGNLLVVGEATNGEGYVKGASFGPGSGGRGQDRLTGGNGTAGQSGFATHAAGVAGNGGTLGTTGATPTAGGAGLTYGAGGGGGGVSTTVVTTAGGAGGAGAVPGGGGGGGGAQMVTAATSNGGAGGAGGDGILYVIAW